DRRRSLPLVKSECFPGRPSSVRLRLASLFHYSGLVICEHSHSGTELLAGKILLIIIFRELFKLILREKRSKDIIDLFHFVNNLTTGSACVDQSPKPQ